MTIAIAGGAGAAIGASLGQLVQWWREHVRTSIEERRRSEDLENAKQVERRAQSEARESELRAHQRSVAGQMVAIMLEIEQMIYDLEQNLGAEGDGSIKAWRTFKSTAIPHMHQLRALVNAYQSDLFEDFDAVLLLLIRYTAKADLGDAVGERGSFFYKRQPTKYRLGNIDGARSGRKRGARSTAMLIHTGPSWSMVQI